MSYICGFIMPIKQTLEGKILYRIRRSKKCAFLPPDFFDLSDRDQVGRVLRNLTRKGILLKVGQGIYARSKRSRLTNNFILEKDLRSVALDALEKLKIKVVPTRYENAYNSGQTTQVPTGLVIGVKSRISRMIGYNGKNIKYEYYS